MAGRGRPLLFEHNRPRQMTPTRGSGSAVAPSTYQPRRDLLYGWPLGQFRDTEAANRDITDLPARKVA